MTLLVRVIEQAEVIGEGRLQSRVTDRDVLWVSVVDDTQQLTHRRLSDSTLIIDTQIALLAELITEVEGRTPVEYCARCVNVYTEVILHVRECCGWNITPTFIFHLSRIIRIITCMSCV